MTTATELIRLAMIYAVQDREAMADSLQDGPDRDEALALAKEFRAYHKRRFKAKYLNRMEETLASATTVGLDELRARNPTNRNFGEGE